MKQSNNNSDTDVDSFCAALKEYNKTHRLIGNVSCETLVSESLKAIKATRESLQPFTLMVDVGAGAGVFGYAWLRSAANRKLVLLEPDKKATGFLRLYFSTHQRAKVIHKRLEDLKLEELLLIEPNVSAICLGSRAFSSNKTLEECYEASGLKIPLFVFEKESVKYQEGEIEKTRDAYSLRQIS
ncbi:MAG: RsmG family class I SAM-dependent methyltransferase [Bdellovibrionota bacterium]